MNILYRKHELGAGTIGFKYLYTVILDYLLSKKNGYSSLNMTFGDNIHYYSKVWGQVFLVTLYFKIQFLLLTKHLLQLLPRTPNLLLINSNAVVKFRYWARIGMQNMCSASTNKQQVY